MPIRVPHWRQPLRDRGSAQRARPPRKIDVRANGHCGRNPRRVTLPAAWSRLSLVSGDTGVSQTSTTRLYRVDGFRRARVAVGCANHLPYASDAGDRFQCVRGVPRCGDARQPCAASRSGRAIRAGCMRLLHVDVAQPGGHGSLAVVVVGGASQSSGHGARGPGSATAAAIGCTPARAAAGLIQLPDRD